MYKRFLFDSDYLSILTKEAFEQLIRDVHDRVWQAEEVSEASIIEYLHGKFEVEKALEVGKIIKDYDHQITYPAGAHFLIDDKPVRALTTINGCKRPSDNTYWELVDDELEMMTPEEEDEVENSIHDSFKPEDLDEIFMERHHHAIIPRLPHIECVHEHLKAGKYSQRRDYFPGQYVKFANNYYKCAYQNGPSFNDIQIPGIVAWEEVETSEWVMFGEYELNSVVSYNGNFYALISLNGYDTSIIPSNPSDTCWGMIADYSEDDTYKFSETEWVVFNGKVYVPTMDPNATVLMEGVNYAPHDPRNSNLKKHILRMAVYELHKLIAPHNVSSARITDYEASMQWLHDAAKMRIDPGIRRCMDEEKKMVTDYGLATFRRDYNPDQNEWQV